MRRAAAVLLAIAALAAPARAEEPAPERRAFVEVDAGKDAYFVGERIVVRLRIGYDAPWFKAHAAPLLRAELDVPVHVSAPYIEQFAVTRPPADPEPGASGRPTRTFALNDWPVTGELLPPREVDGRPFEVVEFARSRLAEEPGTVQLPAPTLRFAYAERIEENVLGERTAVDPKDVVVRGEARTLRVVPLPAAGKPADFTGAVGRFTVRVATPRPGEDVLGRFQLTLVLEGEGNLGAGMPPLRLDGLHVYGSTVSRGRGTETTYYDVGATRDGVTEVPPISFAYFEPGPDAGYRKATAPAVPVRVHGSPPAPGLAHDGSEWRAVEASPPDTSRVALLGAAAVALAAAGVVLSRRRGRARRGAAVAGEAAVAPAEAFRRRVARGEGVADAFAEALAAVAGCTPAAVVGPDLAARLRRAGVAEGPASRAAGAMEALVAERYGGSRTVDAAAAAAILDEATAGAAPAAPSAR